MSARRKLSPSGVALTARATYGRYRITGGIVFAIERTAKDMGQTPQEVCAMIGFDARRYEAMK